jgi:hypothetical protein
VSRWLLLCLASLVAALSGTPVQAGPPYVTDDPQPTDDGHYEIYAFTAGTTTIDGAGGQAGFDLNYGGEENVQLTMVVPFAYDRPRNGPSVTGFGDLELAAKYKFLHQDDFGIDVAIFPRLFLPTNTNRALGSDHASLFIPVFVQKDWGDWSVVGGFGCTINRGGISRDFCQTGLVMERRIIPQLQLGVELFHQASDQKGGQNSTGIGFGAIYDLTENYHLMGWAGPGIQNAVQTNQASWYAALLFTY